MWYQVHTYFYRQTLSKQAQTAHQPFYSITPQSAKHYHSQTFRSWCYFFHFVSFLARIYWLNPRDRCPSTAYSKSPNNQPLQLCQWGNFASPLLSLLSAAPLRSFSRCSGLNVICSVSIPLSTWAVSRRTRCRLHLVSADSSPLLSLAVGRPVSLGQTRYSGW